MLGDLVKRAGDILKFEAGAAMPLKSLVICLKFVFSFLFCRVSRGSYSLSYWVASSVAALATVSAVSALGLRGSRPRVVSSRRWVHASTHVVTAIVTTRRSAARRRPSVVASVAVFVSAATAVHRAATASVLGAVTLNVALLLAEEASAFAELARAALSGSRSTAAMAVVARG